MRGTLSAWSCSSHATFSNSLCVFLSLGYTVPPSCCCWACWLQGKGVLCFDKLLAQACTHFEREPIEDCEHFVYSHFNQLANNIFLHEHLIKWEKQLIHQPEIEKEVLRKHAIFCPNSSDCCLTHSDHKETALPLLHSSGLPSPSGRTHSLDPET